MLSGAHVCPGKGLVQLELKFMIALIVKNFDVHFHPTYDERAFEEGMAELLVVRHGPMPLTFTPRNGRQTGEE